MRARRLFRGVFFFLVATPAFIGTYAQASGKVIEQSRTVGDFSGISAAAGIHVIVEAGQRAPVVVRAEESVLPLVKIEVKGNVLHIGFEPHTSITTEGVLVRVRTPKVDFLGASGGAIVESQAAGADTIKLVASGGSHIKQTGAVKGKSVEVDASGGGEVEISALEAGTVSLHGSGGAVLRMAGKVNEGSLNFSGGSVVHAKSLAVAKLDIHGSGGGTASIDARQIHGSLSGGTSVHVASGATVDVQTSGGSEVVRGL
jgi:hypothetical protein